MRDRYALMRLEVPLGAVGAACVGLAFAFAAWGVPSWIPPAPLVRAGVASPLSGMTRSFVALASGDVTAAFAWHPLGPVCFLAAGSAAVVAAVSLLRGRRLDLPARMLGHRGLWIAVATLFALAWIRQIIVLDV